MTKKKKQPPISQLLSDEDNDPQPPRLKKSAPKSKKRVTVRQSDGQSFGNAAFWSSYSSVDEDPPETPMETDDVDVHQPKRKERGTMGYSRFAVYLLMHSRVVSRKAKEDALNSKSI
jgi:hypothetical protein